jgi:hypothetical protein
VIIIIILNINNERQQFKNMKRRIFLNAFNPSSVHQQHILYAGRGERSSFFSNELRAFLVTLGLNF